MQGRGRGLYAGHETSTNPHPRRAIGQCSGKAPSVSNATRRDNDDGVSRQRAFRVFTNVDDGWNQDRKWRVAGMSSTFSTLCTYDINTYQGPRSMISINHRQHPTLIKGFLHMLQTIIEL